jgi:hypothetical protein
MKLLITRFSSALDILLLLGVSMAFGHDLRFRRASSIHCPVLFFSGRSQKSIKHAEGSYLYFGLEYDAGGNAF